MAAYGKSVQDLACWLFFVFPFAMKLSIAVADEKDAATV